MQNCRRCGIEFEASGSRGRIRVFCSPECRVKPKPIVECRYCGKRVELDLLGGTRKKYCNNSCKDRLQTERKRPDPLQLECRICGAHYETQRKRSATCGLETCQSENVRRNMRKRDQLIREASPPTKVRTCGWCKGEIVIPRSYTGNRLYHPACKARARRVTDRRKNTNRRGVSGQRIGVDQIGDRDNWVCQLCGQPVDSSLSGRCAEGPTVDHILPISKGGLDNLENLQLAHRECNARKGNRVEQRETS
jgi:5-methylcytosine-specific restriction endonuclease McrA